MDTMGLQTDFERQGNFLFRWRSYLPILFIVPFTLAMFNMRWPLDSHRIHTYWEIICLCFSASGLCIRCIVVGYAPAGTSGRNTASQKAQVLNTTGLYGMVRHPLYLGNYLIGLGPTLLPMNWWLAAVFTLCFVIYYERIMFAEEKFLLSKFGEAFKEWATVTPAFVPRLTTWITPSLPFSFRNVLRREYTAFLQITTAFFVVEILGHLVVDQELKLEPFWVGLAILGVIQYIVLRSLKRHTNLLYVKGR